jgi:CheY-like chemotaxis protein
MADFKPPHILLTEDYEPNILVAGTYLEHFGYTYDVARNGTEAVEKACSTAYSVILMDIQMPDMSGFEATQKIREHEHIHGKARVTIIGLTAHALSGDRERCLNAGMDDYLSKPILESLLRDKLRLYIS